ncbi:MAG: phosphoglycerate transporter, partial [Candidatus Dadabacteria bacterium]|nr:phosphoglycerate transporter [Candidatus Dadabacteria bacterium]
MYKLGWFSTGRGPGSRALLTSVYDAIKSGDIKAEIEFVFCSREQGEAEGSDRFIALVKSYGIPLVTFSYQKYRRQYGSTGGLKENVFPEWRLNYDREIIKRLSKFSPDLCVLAGYMLVVGPEMCRKYNMLNLHPALPDGPKGTWQEVMWQLILTKAKETGVMMHLVTPELDRGPVVTYCRFPIRGKLFDIEWKKVEGRSAAELKQKEGEENALFKLIRAEEMKRELPLVITTIKAFSEGRVKVVNGRVFTGDGKEVKGYDLSK